MATVTAGKTFVSGETVTPASLNLLGLPTVDVSDAEIVTSKLNDSAVTAEKLATGAVTGAAGGGKLAASAITAQTQLADALASGDEFLVHDASASALRRVAWSSLQPAGTVINTDYVELVGPKSYSGNTLATNTTAPTTSSGHELASKAFATSSASNYVLLTGHFFIDSTSNGASGVVLLFANSTLIASRQMYGITYVGPLSFAVKHSPASTVSITYSVRAAVSAGTLVANQDYGEATASTVYNTGKQISSLIIQEIKG